MDRKLEKEGALPINGKAYLTSKGEESKLDKIRIAIGW